MRSFISSFKPFLIAGLVIGVIEAGLWLRPWDRYYDSNVLLMTMTRREPVERVLLHEKLQRLGQVSANYLVIGDSSGFYGVQPVLIQQQVPGLEGVNAACVARAGYRGFAHIARHLSRDNDRLQAVVLHVTPFTLPGNSFEDPALEKSLYEEYLSPWRALRPPSNAYRLAVTNLLCSRRFCNELLGERVSNYWGKSYDVWKHELPKLAANRGWMVRPGVAEKIPVTPEPQRLCSDKHPYQEAGFKQVLAVCREKNVPLMVVFNPVPRQPAGYADAAELQRRIDAFAQANPEVCVPFPLITEWEHEAFMDKWHLSEAGSRRHSLRVAQALGQLLGHPGGSPGPIQTTASDR